LNELRLEAPEFADLTRWRWVLRDSSGTVVAEHTVALDASRWQFEAFADMRRYVWWHAAPDRRAEDEARIVTEVGEWIGSEVLGPVGPALAERRPATVRVLVPDVAESLLLRPLELARVGGKPLALRDVTFVMQAGGKAGDVPAAAAAAGERLRVLGLFSAPEDGQPLSLRRERYALTRFIGGIAAAGKAVQARALQYGVTRDLLRDVLSEEGGWDVIHVCGHREPGELLLQTTAGKPDRMSATDLEELLVLARGRVRLVTLTACWPAVMAAAEQRRLLGLPQPDHRAAGRALGDSSAPGALAAGLARRLGCAVLATRYPVSGDFTIRLYQEIYALMGGEGLPLPRAVGAACERLAREAGEEALPALATAPPALFGGAAVNLTLTAPDGSGTADNAVTGTAGTGFAGPRTGGTGTAMEGFPPQPGRFVGRAGLLARASAALASGSGTPGVVLHGPPGAGKTACALELAYGHAHAFESLAWYKAPDAGCDLTGALTGFALTLERHFSGLRMARAVADDTKLAAFLPRLTAAARRRVLIVVDNAESLLTSAGEWRDERWGRVIGALTGHAGPGRLIVTSGTVPAAVAGLATEAVDALEEDESLLLAGELPGLRALIRGEFPDIGREAGRRRVLGALGAARGNPLLLEIADRQAADPALLARLAEAGDHPHVLAGWVRAVTRTLPPPERILFWLLCRLEEEDREQPVVDTTWAALRKLSGGGSFDGGGLDGVIATVRTRGLISVRRGPRGDSYAVHPAVADAGRALAGQPFLDTADAEAALYWCDEFRRASAGAGKPGDADRPGYAGKERAVRAALAAMPYLTRQEEWALAAGLLEAAFDRDPSCTTAAAALPHIQRIVSHEPSAGHVLASVLQVIDPARAEAQLSGALASAEADGDHGRAAAAAQRLAGLYLASGRLSEALDHAGRFLDFARQAGLGPWTQVAGEALRLEILSSRGDSDVALDEVRRLRDQVRKLGQPGSESGADDAAERSGVDEVLLGIGRSAAARTGQWKVALELNAELIASMEERRAPLPEITRARFNDYRPLAETGRTGQAIDLLMTCREVFEDTRDSEGLGKTFGAMASIMNADGDTEAAVRLQRDALRESYLAGDAVSIATGYHNLGSYLPHRPTVTVAIFLASALIFTLADAGGQPADNAVRMAAADLREFGAIPPSDIADMCAFLADIPGTDPARLIARLSPDPEAAERMLRDLLAQARSLANPPPEEDDE
jgi:hypothetical protein